MIKFVIIVLILLGIPLHAQDLFEQAVSTDTEKIDRTYELNGFMRGVFFGGKIPGTDRIETKSGYAETGLKLKIRQQSLGDGFAEIRYRRGSEFGQSIHEFQLREAYVNTYLGKFDFRIGHQIIVWGRADGFNPTNNITPQNMLVRSPDEDDKREGNFLFRGNLNLPPLRLEVVWVPVYAASVLPTSLIPLPEGVILEDTDLPTSELNNSNIGMKADVELASFDGSVSYFHGFNPMPGIMGELRGVDMIAKPKPYRVDVVGADFSTTIGSWGLRGEFAYRNPEEDFQQLPHIPHPDFQYILGMDKTWGDFNLILQYIGRYVQDFTELAASQSPLELPVYELEQKNRLISGQLDEWSHSISFRPALILMHETLNLEWAGYYNFTTEELFFRPKFSYDIADALTLILGAEIYSGPDNTLFGIVDEALSAVYMELRASF